MKRKIFFIVAIVVFIIIAYICIQNLNEYNKIEEFDLEDYYYQRVLEEFSSDKKLGGPIDTPKEAREKAEPVFLEVYGESVKKQKPYIVSYDDENEIWLVYSRGPRDWFGPTEGGSASILMKKVDGKVLAVWHER